MKTDIYESKLLSIVIPVYKNENTIKSCISSVLSQTYKNLELIIVYLPSDDKTLEIVKSLDESRVLLIKQEEKTGPGGARNIGIDCAKGEYIGFVEGDDIVATDFYEKLVSHIERDASDIACGEIMIKIRGKVKLWTSYKQDEVLKGFVNTYKRLTNGASFDKIYRLSLLKKYNVRFQEKVRWEDNPFLLQAFYDAQRVSFVKGAIIMEFSKNFCPEITLYECYDILHYGRHNACVYPKHFLNKLIHYMIDKNLKNFDYNTFINYVNAIANSYPINNNAHKRKFYLFNFIPILKIKNNTTKTKFYLFGFIPILKIKGK